MVVTFGAALRAALVPAPGPWGLVAGLRATAAAALVLGGSVLVADLSAGGIAYLGVACAASFIGVGDLRSRAVRVAGQALGAGLGMTVGALVPTTAAWVIGAAVVVGFLAGAVGRIGPASTGGAVMAVIGVAYTQFGRLAMPWWEPVVAYAIGGALLLALAVPGALGCRGRWAAVAGVLDAAADLAEWPSDAARHRLALASAAARTAVAGYRIRPVSGPIAEVWAGARDAAAQAAALADGAAAPAPEPARQWRERAAEVRSGPLVRSGADRAAGEGGRTPPDRGGRGGDQLAADGREAVGGAGVLGTGEAGWGGWVPSVRAAVRASTGRAALETGARIGLCVGAATALAIALHPPEHAYWIPLTVAVVLRPEYGAVLVRSVHRLVGTLVGVGVVAAALALTSSPVVLSVVAALALGLAAFARPRIYGLAVVGITGSALLSVALANPAAIQPAPRLLDTALGCAVALLGGVLLWPRRGLPDQPRAFATGLDALARIASSAPGATDEAYRWAHAWRAELERDLAEADPARAAAAWLPVALLLERAVDHACTAGGPLALPPERPATPAEAANLLTAYLGR
ncbi:FUSC family protein [Pseudonocardia ailaonensis]|uniref:FUSC family protein n=1 Tax=Pseudonocardia ailaonensis TaxID=367279 RepID=UPI0031CFA6B7